jgi:hypothetical protein
MSFPSFSEPREQQEVSSMRTRKSAGLVAGLVLALASFLASTAAPASGGALRATVFTDPSGDVQGTAPDLTGASIADGGGVITLKVTVAGFAAPAPGAANLVKVYIDGDRNEATGALSQGGAEYTLSAWKDPDGWGWNVNRWSGTKYETMPQSAAMSFSRSGDTLAWTVSAADLGGTSGFAFFVWSSAWDASDNQLGEDVAPDDGSWTYMLTAAPAPTTPTTPTTPVKPVKPAAPSAPAAVKPVIGVPVSTPVTATAGKRFTVVFPVTRKDTGGPMTAGKMVCDPSVLGKVIPHAESFKGGKARLSFVIPLSARSRVLKVKVTIVAGTFSATKIASFRVV